MFIFHVIRIVIYRRRLKSIALLHTKLFVLPPFTLPVDRYFELVYHRSTKNIILTSQEYT